MIENAVRPYGSVVAADDAGHGRETDARAFEVFISVQTVEGVEELVSVEHVKASAVVVNEPGILRGVPAKVDDGMGNLGGELGRVAEKVLERDTEEFGVGVRLKTRLYAELKCARGIFDTGFVPEVGNDDFRKGGDVDGLAGKFGTGDAGELEKSIDELSHALGAGTNALDVIAACDADRIGIVLRKGEGEAVDGAKRSAQIVGDGVGEGLQFAIGRFELRGTLTHAIFKRCVQGQDLGGVLLDQDTGGGEALGDIRGGEAEFALTNEVPEHEENKKEIKTAGDADGDLCSSNTALLSFGTNNEKTTLFGLHAVGEVPEIIRLEETDATSAPLLQLLLVIVLAQIDAGLESGHAGIDG